MFGSVPPLLVGFALLLVVMVVLRTADRQREARPRSPIGILLWIVIWAVILGLSARVILTLIALGKVMKPLN